MRGNPSRTINSVFSHKVCINLDRRAYRWEQMQLKFARHDILGVRRFPALDGKGLILPSGWSSTAGAYGCLLSHLQVVREAKQLGVSSVLIFEDDTVLAPEFNARFAAYSRQLPDDWDMVFFGAIHHVGTCTGGRLAKGR